VSEIFRLATALATSEKLNFVALCVTYVMGSFMDTAAGVPIFSPVITRIVEQVQIN